MELTWTSQQVQDKIKTLNSQGVMLAKRHIKKIDPELLRHAMYYYPSWEHACREVGITL